jgi:hypothetical protein
MQLEPQMDADERGFAKEIVIFLLPTLDSPNRDQNERAAVLFSVQENPCPSVFIRGSRLHGYGFRRSPFPLDNGPEPIPAFAPNKKDCARQANRHIFPDHFGDPIV